MDIFKSLGELGPNVGKVALAPVEMTVDLTNAAVKPMAEVAEEMTDSFKEIFNDDD